MVKPEDETHGYFYIKEMNSAGSTQVQEPTHCKPGTGWPWEYKDEEDRIS